jgi:hypothetical protein
MGGTTKAAPKGPPNQRRRRGAAGVAPLRLPAGVEEGKLHSTAAPEVTELRAPQNQNPSRGRPGYGHQRSGAHEVARRLRRTTAAGTAGGSRRCQATAETILDHSRRRRGMRGGVCGSVNDPGATGGSNQAAWAGHGPGQP